MKCIHGAKLPPTSTRNQSLLLQPPTLMSSYFLAEPPEGAPVLTALYPGGNATNHQVICLVCNSSGVFLGYPPSQRTHWYRNEQTFTITNTTTLTLGTTLSTYGGWYSCRLSNDRGMSQKSAPLMVDQFAKGRAHSSGKMIMIEL